MTRWKVLAAVFIWGAAFAFTKRALSELSPLALTLMRSGLGSLTMLLWARTPGLFRAMRPKEWLQLGAIALSGVVGQQLIQAYALRGTSANHAGWILAATPIIVTLAMALFFGERIGPRCWSGFALGAAGTALVALSRQSVCGAGLIATRRGDLLIMASCCNWALYVIMMDRWLRSRSQRAVTVMSMVTAFGINTAAALAGGQWRELAHVSAGAWACLGYLGVLSSGFGYLWWNAGVEAIGPSATAAFLYLEPLAALVAGRLLLGEGIAATALLGGALILLGVYWVNSGRELPRTPEEAA